MRLNKFIADATGVSRRKADQLIIASKVSLNDKQAYPGDKAAPGDRVLINNELISLKPKLLLALNKPPGYVCSRRSQGNKTVYELIPPAYHHLKPIGRLDKDSSGLLLLSNDGGLANELTHPKYQKQKKYEVTLDKELSKSDTQKLLTGVELADGLSKFIALRSTAPPKYEVTISQGRNRQIRRTFAALNYKVVKLHRINIGKYQLDNLSSAKWKLLNIK